MRSTGKEYCPTIVDAIEALVPIVGRSEDHVVFMTCISRSGLIGASACFASATQSKMVLDPNVLFALPVEKGADAVLITSQSSGSIEELHEADLEFTGKLVRHSREIGISIAEHVLVKDDLFRLLSESMPLI